MDQIRGVAGRTRQSLLKPRGLRNRSMKELTIDHLYKMPAEELVKIGVSEWRDVFSEIHPEDLRLLSNSLINLSVLSARMSVYIDARGGEGGRDRGHIEAVKEQNLRAERVRYALGFQQAKADIDLS